MKKFLTFALVISMMASLAASASALEYSIAPPKDFDFGKDTSIEVIHTADGGATKNADMSKNTALIPPAFGSESTNALPTGTTAAACAQALLHAGADSVFALAFATVEFGAPPDDTTPIHEDDEEDVYRDF